LGNGHSWRREMVVEVDEGIGEKREEDGAKF